VRFFLSGVLSVVIVGSLLSGSMAEHEWKSIRCACVGSKSPAHKDYQIIRALFPGVQRIQRLLYKEKTYYILVEKRKIDRILSGWESGVGNQHIWLVLNQESQLLEVIRYPQKKRILLKEKKYYLRTDLPSPGDDYLKVILLLQKDLGMNWESFVRRIRLNIHKLDAISQATP
jgi:hypothetical protein